MSKPLAISDEAFRELYDTTCSALERYLTGLGADPDVARDLAQESYLRLLTGAPSDLDGKKLVSYLYTIATRLAFDRWRSRDVELRWREALPNRQDTAEISDERPDLVRAMERLTLRQRTLLWLAYIEEFSHREIGAVMNMGEKSVRVMLHRSRKKLERVLTEMGISKE